MPNTLTPWLSRRGGHGRVAMNSYLALLPFPLLSEPSSCQFSEPRGRMRENYWPGGVARAHHDRLRAGPQGRLHHPRVSGDSAVCGWSIFGGRGSIIPWPARARRRRLPRGLLWPVGEHAPLHARANAGRRCGGGFSNPLSPFRQRTRPEPNTGSRFQGHLRVPGPAGETGLGSPSPHAPCHTTSRPGHKPSRAARLLCRTANDRSAACCVLAKPSRCFSVSFFSISEQGL